MGDFIGKNLAGTLGNFSGMVMEFLPRLLAMAIIIVVGGVIAWIVKAILRRILAWVRFNSLFENAGITQMMPKTSLPSPSEL
ncbi:MAG: mechanosensitive ion channel family protein, partial [Terriglobia bacterium]